MIAENRPMRGAGPSFYIDDEWLAQIDEEVIDPGLPIIDTHHHLWDHKPVSRYLMEELLKDLGGHNVRATVFVECAAMYNVDVEPRFSSIGEVEFANGVAARSASGVYGDVRICAGIVGNVDLMAGSAADEVLEACVGRAPSRFRGIRNIATWVESQVSTLLRPPPKDMLLNPRFREGFACLARRNLSFDAWLYHPQLPQLIDLADQFPDTTIVLNHCGGRMGIGPYAARQEEVWVQWRDDINRIAKRPNVFVKLGGLGMRLGNFGFHDREIPPTSQELANAWQPYVETCIEAFGTERSMFESNFPVDKGCCSYRILWNAFKRMAEGYSASEKTNLFAGTAVRAYRLPPSLLTKGPMDCGPTARE